MAKVHLVRRWGSHDAGQEVDVDDAMAAWLLGTHHAERTDRRGTARAGVTAPGTDGPDLRAGGDVSRPGVPQTRKGPRYDGKRADDDGNFANRAARVPGAPRTVGDVSHVNEDNLGAEHKEHPGEVLLASGKTLSEERQERQRELDEQDRKAAQKSGEAKPAASGEARPASGQSPQQGEPRTVTPK